MSYINNKQFLIINDYENECLVINLKESPLRWLASFKEKNGQAFLGEHELLAGEHYRRDFEISGLSPRLSIQLETHLVDGKTPELFSDKRLAAKQRLENANRVLGPELTSLCLDFLGFLKSIELCEQERNWPQRSAKIVIKLALAHLARHYGYRPKRAKAK